MKRLLVFLLFFVMIGATPIWADVQILERQLTLKQIRVEVILLYQVVIRKNQLPHINQALVAQHQQQIPQTHIQAIVGL